jgi:GLPGLI family protein
MKKLFLIITAFLIVANLHAQSYEITYERTVNLHKSLPKGKKMLKLLIPEEIKNNVVYKHKDHVAQLTECPFEKDESNEDIQTDVSKSVYVFLHQENIVREYEDFNGYTYFVESKFDNVDLEKLSGVKIINGYQCKSAKIKSEKEEEFILWYTNELPVSASPLPPLVVNGAILEVENEKIQYKLVSVKKQEVTLKEINTKDAISISEEQMSDLRKEQQEQKGESVSITL